MAVEGLLHLLSMLAMLWLWTHKGSRNSGQSGDSEKAKKKWKSENEWKKLHHVRFLDPLWIMGGG